MPPKKKDDTSDAENDEGIPKKKACKHFAGSCNLTGIRKSSTLRNAFNKCIKCEHESTIDDNLSACIQCIKLYCKEHRKEHKEANHAIFYFFKKNEFFCTSCDCVLFLKKKKEQKELDQVRQLLIEMFSLKTGNEGDLSLKLSSVSLSSSNTPKGLSNLGNTCFMNASLQALFSLQKTFLPAINSEICNDSSSPTITQSSLNDLLHNMNTSSSKLSPREFFTLLCSKYLIYKSKAQQDAHEFVRRLLGILQDESENGDKIIEKTFKGNLKSIIKCLKCKSIYNSSEPYFDLSLPIAKPSVTGAVTLEQCIDLFLEPDHLIGDNAFACSKCIEANVDFLSKDRRDKMTPDQFYQPAMKEWAVSPELPPVLVFHLKRFQMIEKGMSTRKNAMKIVKNETEITFPLYLEGSTLHKISHLETGEQTYSLVAAVVHDGNSPFSGHYTAYIKRNENSWFYASDERVVPVTTEKLLECVTDVYILFYEKIP